MNNTNGLPNGPTGNKFLLTMKAIRQPIALFEECRKAYGKIYTMPPLSGYPISVVISDPVYLKQVFSASSEQLNTGVSSKKLIQPILGDFSLLSLDGKNHLHHRKLLLPSFHGQRMEVYGELMASTAQKKILSWKKGDALKLEDEARDITFHVILKTIFGMDEENARFEELTILLHALIRVMSKPFSFFTLLNSGLHRNFGVLTPWAKMMKLRHKVDRCLFEEIEARRKINLDSRTDILSLLLQARDEAGNLMTNQEIRDEMLTLLMAGHETSTMGISWAFYGILSNPEVFNKLKDELAQIVPNKEELVKNLDKLVYLDAVIKEALRITPVIPYVARITNEPYQLGEYLLPKGTAILPCIYLAHRDPDVWSEPDKFMPERFLNTSDIPYTYLPFGVFLHIQPKSAMSFNKN